MPAIRQQINIDAPLRAVWNALTTDDGMSAWWARTARVEAREGGRVVLAQDGPDGEPVELRGMFHEFRPTRKIEIAWDTAGKAAARGTRVSFQVARDGEETRLSVLHSGAGALEDDAARTALEEEWKQVLLKLRTKLEETPTAP